MSRIQMRTNRQAGQILTLFALLLVVLILFVGLGIDVGFAYITKAQLSKALDAACLAGMSNFYQGSNIAHDIAISTFDANYATNGIGGRDTKAVALSVVFGPDSAGNNVVTAQATATIRTFFIRVLPQWATMNVSDTAVATRARLVMTLVLDRSGSMDPTCSGSDCSGGGQYLPNAVQNFINVFDDNSDKAAVVTFASSVSNDVVMAQPFKTKVTTAVNYIAVHDLWAGGTFAHGGLTNALAINNSVVIPANQNAIKAVVFFTDGMADMVQGTASCPTGTPRPWNFGGRLGSDAAVSFFPTNAPVTDQTTETCSTLGGPRVPVCCNGNSDKFLSIDGTSKPYKYNNNVMAESTNRCLQVADQMRAAGMYVYCVGLDANAIGPSFVDFLQRVANDEHSPTFDHNKPIGIAEVVGNGSDLNDVFQEIASAILLRLTQ